MFGWDDSHQAYQQVYDTNTNQPRDASFGQEALAGAASFGAMKMWEDHQRREGKPVSHSFAKEALAGFVGLEVDKFGQNEYDKEQMKRQATDNVQNMYDDHYGSQGDQYDPNQMAPHPNMQQYGNW